MLVFVPITSTIAAGFSQSMFIWKPMWAITNDFFKATQISFDHEIIEIFQQISATCLCRHINEIVGCRRGSPPRSLSIDGKRPRPSILFARNLKVHGTLGDYFMGYVIKNNHSPSAGETPSPAMPPPGTKRQARRPRVPSQRFNKWLKAESKKKLQHPPRNAPCPCGSGKKLRHCHGAAG